MNIHLGCCNSDGTVS